MSVLTPFKKCIARPSEKGKTFLLEQHLLNVRSFVEKKFSGEDKVLSKLVGLAAICHDILKAQADWQVYIRNFSEKKKGPSHAPGGAFLFSFLAWYLLKSKDEWEKYKIYWLWLTRDIADHHGALKSLNDKYWVGSGNWRRMDLEGVADFIKEQYPEFVELKITEAELEQWSEDVYDIWEEVLDELNQGYLLGDSLEYMQKLQIWRRLTTNLIAGDRFDVTETFSSQLDPKEHLENEQNLQEFCVKNKESPLTKIRIKAQEKIMGQIADCSNARFYTLEMPTGYGKTITALKIATWLGKEQGYSKIIYVAPYLSILEQTSRVIGEAMGRTALEHHSLAVLEKDTEKIEKNNPQSQLVMEAWAHSIVCTSFQQWSKALFPKRAQNVLRRAFLKNSVVIIDEPQIFDPNGWNVFLCGLEAIAELYNLKVIFLSATMPPFEYGLSKKPERLVIEASSQAERYQVVRQNRMDEVKVADFLLSRPEKLQAAILNTIEDAYLVCKALSLQGHDIKMVHGMMIPIHKNIIIAKIKDHLQNARNKSLLVISTQVLEAGVDVSFQHLVRALPILPSLVQAAGRVNRHHEEQIGTLSLVPFYRGGEKDTRNSIYNERLQKITDKILSRKTVWQESEMLNLIKEYYREMFRQNTYEASKQAIQDAYEGDWPKLSQYQPFGEDYPRLPIFVPWQIPEEDREWLPERFVRLQKQVGVANPEKIYTYYENREYMAKLSFEERKKFMILFNHFVINVPMKLAFSLVGKEKYLENKIPILLNADDYDSKTGLAKRRVEGFDNLI